jgi:hypothetical protein
LDYQLQTTLTFSDKVPIIPFSLDFLESNVWETEVAVLASKIEEETLNLGHGVIEMGVFRALSAVYSSFSVNSHKAQQARRGGDDNKYTN